MESSNSNNWDVIDNIAHITKEDWNGCVHHDQPFSRHEFLLSLEESGCVSPQNGWLAQHIVLRDNESRLKACAPLYLKSHSYGEYVFDWSWADAYERAGGRYYPKLQCAIPFTPVTGNRLLLHPRSSLEEREHLLEAMTSHARKLGVSSLHMTFCTEEEVIPAESLGLMAREGHQYHWDNQGYQTFDDFLDRLSSRKRKDIRKERRAMTEHGIEFKVLNGENLKDHHWDEFYAFYLDTSGRKWGHAYLNIEFFQLLGQRMAEEVVLVLAQKEGRTVAGALNLKGSETLYGRYWGCLEDYRFLHFETCYYQAIDFAIKHKLKRVEAGAQGEHKIKRGYLPVKTHSAHWVSDPAFKKAVENYLHHERQTNIQEIEILSKLSPYKSE